ncbi:hypothetical protein ACP70R_033791 [Stipagrostis hirtigluma subsp. patula]
MGRKRETKKQGRARQQGAKSSSKEEGEQVEAGSHKQQGDLISSKLPDDILARILSLVPYKQAVRASATCRRWKNLYLQLPHVYLFLLSRGAGAVL